MAVAEVSTKGAAGEIVVYPDSDGEPMADNTLQFEWIMLLKENLETLFQDEPDVFVAGDLLWYPVEGDNKTRMAPDALVAFGRPKGYRGSYEQWEEGGVAPQVVFEVLSPGNRAGKMREKFEFYEEFGVEEYYPLDPESNRRHPFRFEGWRRDGLGILQPIPALHNYISRVWASASTHPGTCWRFTVPTANVSKNRESYLSSAIGLWSGRSGWRNVCVRWELTQTRNDEF